ncbi:MAG: hypothetical protein ACYC3L_01090 [Gemmatimonadaceae bacterium]
MSVLLPYSHDEERDVLLHEWRLFAEARARLETILRIALAGRGRIGATVTNVTSDGVTIEDEADA